MSEQWTPEQYQAHLAGKKKGGRSAKKAPPTPKPTPVEVEGDPVTTEFTLPFITPSLNKTLKEYRNDKTRRRTLYERYIMAATKHRHPGRVLVEIYRHSYGVLDSDNLRGGAKKLLDALKNRQVILDDTTDIIGDPKYEQVRIRRPQKPFMLIRITDVKHGDTTQSVNP